MKVLNRTLSLFLVLAMVAGLFVTFPVFAAESTIDTSNYTVSLFKDGPGDGVDDVMTLDKWTKMVIGTGSTANGATSVTTDGYLTVAAGCASEIHGVTPNATLPANYVAEMTGIFSNRYCHNAAIRLKTVGTTNYYLLGCWDGTNSGNVKYGISTNITPDMNATYLGDTFSIARTEADIAADWKFIVIDNTIEVWRNDELKLTYTNDDFTTADAVSHFDPVFFSINNYSATSAKLVMKISEINIYREMTEEELTVASCTKTVFNEDFETNDVNVNFTASGSKYELTKAELGGDNVLAFKSTHSSGGGLNWAYLKSKNEFSGKSVSEFTVNFAGSIYPDRGQIVLGKIGSKNLSLCIGFNNTETGKMGFGLVTSGSDSETENAATGTAASCGVSFDTDLKFKVISTDSNVIVYINNSKRYTYTYAEDETDRFVSAPGIEIGASWLGNRYIYLDDITIKQEPSEEEKTIENCTKTVLYEDFETNDVNVNFTVSGSKYESSKINLDGDNVLAFRSVTSGGSNAWANVLSKNSFSGKSVTEFTVCFDNNSSSYYPDKGQIILGQIGSSYLSLCVNRFGYGSAQAGGFGFGLVSGLEDNSMSLATKPASTYGVAFDTDLKFKVISTGSSVIVYLNDSKVYTYSEADAADFISAPGISIGINYSKNNYIYLDDVIVKQEVTEADMVDYTITGIPESGTVENATTKRITISAETEGLANNIKNTISLKANGENVGGAFMYPDSKTIMINVNKLTSNTDYTLTFTPGYRYGVTQKTYTFTTGTITPVTDVAEDATVTSNAEKTQWVYALDSSYDLTEVAVTGAAGATVKLTRDENLTAEKMTTLGTVTDGNTMEISGDKIGRYKYIVIESETAIETAPTVSAAKSDLGDDWLKQRTLNMANADMRFASFSDLHNLSQTTNDTLNTVMSGFDAMSNDIDAMTLVGDIVYWNPNTTLDSDVTNNGDGTVTGAEEGEDIDIMTNRYKVLSDALNTYGYNNKQNNKTDGKATVWVIGNHEYAEPYNNYTIREAKTDVVVNNCIGYYDTHQVVNGYHLIGAALSSGLQITAEKAQWILDEVEAAEAEDPTQPIFVFTHVKLPNMVYPDSKTYNGTNYWNTAGSVIEELKKHKQVIIISGHEHAIAQLPGNIGQDGLTQVMLGVTGGGNMGRNPGTVNANSDPIYPGSYNPQGLMFEVKDNVTYIYRIDLKDQAVIGEPWVIDAEGRVNEQLEDTYTKARYENATAPYFEEGAIDNVEISKSGTNLVVKFPQAKTESTAGDNYVKAYEIHVKYPRTNSDVAVTSDISDYYFLNEKTQMAETVTFTFAYPELLNSFDCNVEIYPVSTYHIYGEPLVKTVAAVNQDTGLTEEELAKAKPDADVLCLDFYEKSTTDCVKGVKPTETDVISSLSYDEAYNTDKIRLLALSNNKTYQYFGGSNYLTYTIDNAPENGYTLEASFNIPTAQKKLGKTGGAVAAEHKLIGTDAHSLYVDESSNVVFKYTVDGTAKTIKCPVPTSAWFHAAATLSDTEAKLYIDGRAVASATVSGTIDPFGTDVSLGNNAILSVLKARVYGKALSVGEVDKLMIEHNTVLSGDTADSQIKLLSLNAPVTTLSGSYEANSGSESVLTDGTLSGSIDTASVIYGSQTMDIKIDLGKEYDADTIVLYASKNYMNHRMELTVQASREEADSDKSLRTNLVTVPRKSMNDGYDIAGAPIYLTVPDGVGPIRYIYLSKTTVSGLNCFALILAEVQVFGRECDPVRETRIADVDYTDTAVTAVTLKSTSATPGTTCTVVVAAYDEDGDLVSAEMVKDVVLNKDYKEQVVEFTTSPDLSKAAQTKVFVWSDMENIEPVMDVRIIK